MSTATARTCFDHPAHLPRIPKEVHTYPHTYSPHTSFNSSRAYREALGHLWEVLQVEPELFVGHLDFIFK